MEPEKRIFLSPSMRSDLPSYVTSAALTELPPPAVAAATISHSSRHRPIFLRRSLPLSHIQGFVCVTVYL